MGSPFTHGLRVPMLLRAALLIAFPFATSSHVTGARIYYTDQPGSTDGSVMSVALDGTGQTWTNESSVTFVDAEMDSVTAVPAAALAGVPQAFFRITISTNESAIPTGNSVTQSTAGRTDRSRRPAPPR